MKKKTINKKKINRECWNLDYELILWINIHLKTYLKAAFKVIDGDYNKFTYRGTTYTLKQLVCHLIWLTNDILREYNWSFPSNEIQHKVDEMYDLLKLAHWNLWW